MKKVLFSSVCAVALLGSNVYAIDNINNSLDFFLTQKTELENKINAQNILITQKLESLNSANTDYQTKDKTYKDLSIDIINATTTAGEKEGLKNKAELEYTGLINQGTELNIQKENLNSQLVGINDLITKQNTAISDLTSQIATSQTNVEAKKKTYDDLVAQLDVANVKHKELVNAEIKAIDEHEQALVALEKDPDNQVLKDKADAALKTKNEVHMALKISDDEIAPLTEKKGQAFFDFNEATKQHNDLVFKQRAEQDILTKYQGDLDLKNKEIQAHEQKIAENKTLQIQAQTKVDEAMKVYNDALAAIQTAKQKQNNVKSELDLASVNLSKLEKELQEAQEELKNLNTNLVNITNTIKELEQQNTDDNKENVKPDDSVKIEELKNIIVERIGLNFTKNQEDINSLVSLIVANGSDLSTASAEVKAEAKIIADKIATTIINEQKSEISSDVLSSLNVSINNMNKRLGEIRGLNEDLGVWFRAYGGRFSNDNSHFNYYSTQIGADKKTDFNNGDLIAGALFGYDKVNSNAKSKGFNVGGYLSYISNDGYFTDLVLKYIHTGYDKAGIKSQNSFLASVESGYRFNVYQNTYLEPSLELITGYVGKYEAKTNRTTISMDSYVPLIIKPQVFAGYSVNDFSFRAGVGAILDTKKHTANILISDIVKGINANASTKLDSNNRGFVSLGGSYKFNDNLRLNLSVERSFGSSLTNDYEINSTIRYTF